MHGQNHLQYFHAPPGGHGPPVENPCAKAIFNILKAHTQRFVFADTPRERVLALVWRRLLQGEIYVVLLQICNL